jgi:hypothetical protein
MTIWTRFPTRMRRALVAAMETAGDRGCDEVAVEHLAAAVYRDHQSAASFILESAGVSRTDLLKRLERIAPTGPTVRQRAGRLSIATLRLLELAAVQADRWKHPHIGTEHVALALAVGNDGPTGRILQEMGLTPKRAEAGLHRWIAEQMPRQGVLARRPWIGKLPRRLRRIIALPLLGWNIFIRKSLGHPRFVSDPYPLYRWLRDRPVRRDPLAPVWVVSRYADVTTLLKDPRFRKDPFAVERLPADVRQQLGVSDDAVRTADIETVSMLFLDPPQHTRVRSIFSRAFTPKMIAGLRPRIQQITDECLAKALPAGQMDLIEILAYPLPVIVIAKLLGFPAKDFPLYKKWSDDFTAALGINPTPAEQETAAKSRQELHVYFDNLVEKMKRPTRAGTQRVPEVPAVVDRRLFSSAPNLISALLEMEDEPGALSREELFINSSLLLAAGHETTTNLIANGMLALLKHPDQLRALRDEPALIESAVEELLRYDSPVQWVSRVVDERLELGGVMLEPGAILLGSVGSANHDPRQFADPDRLDVRRSDNRHLSFGSGVHFCLGATLARMEAQIAINTLVQRLPNLRLAEAKIHWKKGLIFRAARRLHVHFDPITQGK